MKIIVDTHAFLWYISADERLSNEAKNAIGNHGNIKLISMATFWEIGIKLSLGRLKIHKPFETLIDVKGFQVMDIKFNHIVKLLELKLFHKDPFDRLIIAQALTENISVVSKDKIFKKYGIKLIWS